MERTLACIAVAALIGVPLSGRSQLVPVAERVKYHQSSMPLIRGHLRRIAAAVIDTQHYDKAAIEADVAIIGTMLRQDVDMANWQIATSMGEAEIWKEQGRFKAASEKMQTTTEKLAGAATSGDLNAIRAALQTVDQSCMACHANYRVR